MASGGEAQLEKCFHAGAAPFQCGNDLARSDAIVVDASRRGDAVLAAERLDPHAAGVVKVSGNRADRAPRSAGSRDVPKRGRQTLDELRGDAVVRSPGGEEARAQVRHAPII